MMLFLRLLRWLTLSIAVWLSPEEIEKAVPFDRGWLSPRSNAVIVGVWTDIRFGDLGSRLSRALLLFVRRRGICAI